MRDHYEALGPHFFDAGRERVLYDRCAWRIQIRRIEGIRERYIERDLVAVDSLNNAIGVDDCAGGDPRLRRAVPYQGIHAHEVNPRRSHRPPHQHGISWLE